MKKLSLTLLSFILTFSIFAGGLVTNTNQSATWTRMMVRDASTSIDAVYYNPAGLTKLSDGLHISISNQTLGQTKNVVNDFAYLNGSPADYQGDVSAPMFPGFYAAYKTGKIVFSFGFNPIGGGGSADFAGGLPSIELPVSTLVPSFAAQGVTAYGLDMEFSGTSVYFGFQAGISYEINDMISIFAGGRYVMAKNTYKGKMENITVTVGGNQVPAETYITGVANQLTALSNIHTSLSAIQTAGYGGLTFAQAQGYGIITAEEKAGMDAGLLSLGLTQAQVDAMTIDAAQPVYQAASPAWAEAAAGLNATAPLMGNQEADVVQTGSGFTPIAGLNLSFMEDKLNIGIKYEFKTNLEITNETASDVITGSDGSSMFPDKEVINADMPAMLSIGAKYQITDALNVHAGFHTYFDTKVNWKNVAEIEGNSMEYALGLEYNISEKLLVSAGWLGTKTGVKDTYHTDLSYSLNTNSIGGGGAFAINNMITIQLGGFMTMYQDFTANKSYPLGDAAVPFKETYKKSAWGVGIGLDFTFGGGGE